ncbi:MAG: hypothetical protein ACLTF5_10245 [Butyricicoccus sp.]
MIVVGKRDVMAALVPVFYGVEQLAAFRSANTCTYPGRAQRLTGLHHMPARLKIRRADRQIDDVHAAFEERLLALVELLKILLSAISPALMNFMLIISQVKFYNRPVEAGRLL